MNLNEIIEALEKALDADGNRLVRHGFNGSSPHSFRGFYHDLAFDPASDVQLADMLAGLYAARGQAFEGYKGGQYLMNGGVDVYIAEAYAPGGDRIGPTLVAYWTAAP